LDLAASRVRHFDFRRSLVITRSQLDAGTEALRNAFRTRLAERKAHLERLAAKLDALSPVKILDRGYALIFDSSGTLVKDATRLSPGEQVSARVTRGSFTAEVKTTGKD
jgi:exodeoxyribonuclease VII large subunit